jgi:hypothetical protein
MTAKMLFLFKSTRDVIRAEKFIRKAGLECVIIPVPRSVSSECGMCIETEQIHEKSIDLVLKDTAIITTRCTSYVK